LQLKPDIVTKFLREENMCLAIPGKITSIDSANPDLKMAKVSFGGIVKDVCIQWLDEIEVNDYVIVHAGFALNKIDVQEAEETIRALNEMENIIGKQNS
jgi:hydrogenase expression/formation protein HypC